MNHVSIQTKSFFQRIVLIIATFAILVWFGFLIKWSLANSMSTQAEIKEISQLAIDLSPNDPQPYYSLAALNERSLSPNDLADAVANYEKAASLSPNNYLLWLALGKARERNDDSIGAEKALRKALELAPNYSEIHWVLGNILLRNDKQDEAFAEIRKAAETNTKYVNPAVSTALQFFEGDFSKLTTQLGESDEINAALAILLAQKGNLDESLKISRLVKTLNPDNANSLLASFLGAKKFRAASEIEARMVNVETEKASLGKFINHSFESEVKPTGAGTFDWQLTDASQPVIAVDNRQKQEGNLSLAVVFNSTDGKDFRQISQMIAVESGKKYRFQSFAKADLKATSTLRWEIIDAADSKLLGATNAISAISDWQKLDAEFTTNSNTEAVLVRLARVSCGSSVCPISGKVWFDNFSLQ
jgi:tetratricopeptide (TPR) repeat protein